MSNKKKIEALEAEIKSFPKGDKDFRSYKIRREIAKLQAEDISNDEKPKQEKKKEEKKSDEKSDKKKDKKKSDEKSDKKKEEKEEK